MVNLSTLLKKFHEISPEDVRNLEELLPKVAGKFVYGNASSGLLSKVAEEASVQTTSREQVKASHELPKYWKALDIVTHRPNILDLLEKNPGNNYIPLRVFNYFDPNNYHDRFLKLCGESLLKGDVENLRDLVRMGYDHIVWTNICDRAIDNFKLFKDMQCSPLKPTINIENPDYPSEFFRVLNYLEQRLIDYGIETYIPFVDAAKEMRLPVDEKRCLGDMIKIGRLEKVGFATINTRILRQTCINFSENLDRNLANLIKINYLDREIDNYLECLDEIKQNLTGMGVHESLEELKKEVENLLRTTRTPVSSSYVYGRLIGLEEEIKSIRKMRVPRKKDLPEELHEYRYMLFRRSKDYLAASIVMEAICHVAHEFPFYTQEYEFESETFPSDYDIPEMPTTKTIRYLAKKFNLRSTNLKKQHQKTAKICRHAFLRDFKIMENEQLD